ncbi:NAD(P)-dependent alcohol dehydrogenase [Streptomyces sp. NRRL S-87]|uniref:NAD(P)-dependent alcohol dehydrogenase n=1 Tax=Streptomyces sp. NRRL S-87 TaxID=1463920 RepID=UPI0004C034A2|nr:NAD(P)-dependent alcohol dehydrogenase [Streptomyces sp. NRRL S-87]
MQAIVQDRYGPAEVLALADVPVPVPGPREVLVRVRAAGVHIGDWHVMTGLPSVARLGLGLRRPRARVRGLEFAGRVEAAGARVTGFRPGDEVFGVCAGAFAEFACAREDRIAARPADVGWAQAAALPVSGQTALQALRLGGPPRPGRRVLVIGAGGAVGSYAVQLAKAGGAEVTGVCSTGKAELVRTLGADRVVDYTREDFAAVGTGHDLVLDMAGSRPLPELRRALAADGTLVVVGGEGGGHVFGTLHRQLRASLPSFSGGRLRPLVAVDRASDLRELAALAASGTIRPVIDRAYGLAEVPEALRRLGEGHNRGKAVVTIAGDGPGA